MADLAGEYINALRELVDLRLVRGELLRCGRVLLLLLQVNDLRLQVADTSGYHIGRLQCALVRSGLLVCAVGSVVVGYGFVVQRLDLGLNVSDALTRQSASFGIGRVQRVLGFLFGLQFGVQCRALAANRIRRPCLRVGLLFRLGDQFVEQLKAGDSDGLCAGILRVRRLSDLLLEEQASAVQFFLRCERGACGLLHQFGVTVKARSDRIALAE